MEERRVLLWKQIAYLGRVGKQPVGDILKLTRSQFDMLLGAVNWSVLQEQDAVERD